MLSIHREIAKENKSKLIEEVLEKFASDPRKLLL